MEAGGRRGFQRRRPPRSDARGLRLRWGRERHLPPLRHRRGLRRYNVVAAGDYNGDGIADVAAGVYHKNCFVYDPMQPPDYKFIAVWFGNPTWTVPRYRTVMATDNYPVSVVIIPGTPGHGGLLFVAADGCDLVGCYDARWYRFDSPEHPLLPWESKVETCAAAAADLDDDGVIDINTGERVVLMGEGDGTYTPVKNHPRPSGTRFGWDLDCDGLADAIDLGWSPPAYSVDLWRGLGGGRYSRVGAVLDGGVRDAILADINHDGDADIVACTADGVVTRIGGPGLTFAPALDLLEGGCDELIAADLNADGATDLVLFEQSTSWDSGTKLRLFLAGT